MGRGLNADRRPGSVAEARTLVAYNERILEMSRSPQRRDRAARMLVNLRPELARLEQAAAGARSDPVRPPSDDEEFEVVWNGNSGSLTGRE